MCTLQGRLERANMMSSKVHAEAHTINNELSLRASEAIMAQLWQSSRPRFHRTFAALRRQAKPSRVICGLTAAWVCLAFMRTVSRIAE